MAKGKEIATFSLSATSVTYIPGPAGSTITQANYEGTASGGFGTIGGTGSFVGGGKGGSLSYCGAAYMENGEVLYSTTTGTYESSGTHRWRTAGVMHLSDGTEMYSEGEIDLATRAWTGKVYEWS